MSSPTTNSGTPKKPTTNGKSGKKPKSPGFIESSQFKPTWLETGPLSPDMLPDLTTGQTAAAIPSDELAERLSALQQLYQDQTADETHAVSTGPRIKVVSDQSQAVAKAPQPIAEIVPTPATIEPIAEFVEPVAVVEAAELSTAATLEAPAVAMAEPVVEEIVAPAAQAMVEAAPEAAAVAAASVAAATVITEMQPVAPAAEPVPIKKPAKEPTPAKPKEAKPRKEARTSKAHTHKLMDRTAWLLALGSLLFLGLAVLSSVFNPLQRLALSTATLARPSSPSGLTAPAGETNWCVSGDFLGTGEPLRMVDNGASGDLVADDQIYSAQYTLPQGSGHTWQVVNCSDQTVVYPSSPSWVQAHAAGEAVTFTFDSRERNARLFFPIPFVVSAEDGTTEFRVVGSFQDWDANDPSSVLEPIGPGLYQQVRKIARAGTHEAYVIAGDDNQAIDAYGRTTEPNPFSFQTSGRGDYAVFLMDVNRGRASVLFGMSPALTYFAYGPGARLISLALAALGALLLGWLIARLLYMRNPKHWLESGCQSCGRHELMRVARHSEDRVLNGLGFPVYRYQCRDCTWEGMKLSKTGAPISPLSSSLNEHAATARAR